MDEFWRAFALDLASAFIPSIAGALATAIVGWLVFWWQKLFKSNIDEKSRATIHEALERGIAYGLQTIKARGVGYISTNIHRAELLTEAAAYAEKWSGGTVTRLKLSHSDLMELATPHLPLPAEVRLPDTVMPVPASRKTR